MEGEKGRKSFLPLFPPPARLPAISSRSRSYYVRLPFSLALSLLPSTDKQQIYAQQNQNDDNSHQIALGALLRCSFLRHYNTLSTTQHRVGGRSAHLRSETAMLVMWNVFICVKGRSFERNKTSRRALSALTSNQESEQKNDLASEQAKSFQVTLRQFTFNINTHLSSIYREWKKKKKLICKNFAFPKLSLLCCLPCVVWLSMQTRNRRLLSDQTKLWTRKERVKSDDNDFCVRIMFLLLILSRRLE